MMKKFVVWLILMCLLLSGCAADDLPNENRQRKTVPTEITETTEPETTETTLPPHSPLYIEGLSVEDVICYFNEVCLDAEFVNNGDATVVQKWTVPIYYYLNGGLTRDDYVVLTDFLLLLNDIEGFPGIYIARDLGQANMNIYFCDQEQLLNIMGDNYAGLDGAVTFWYENDEIYNANVCIRTDLEQTVRNSVILEEIYNGLGPVQDTSLREDSIIYAGYSEPQELTDIDLLILQLLYHPDIKCGMNASACEEVIRSLYY